MSTIYTKVSDKELQLVKNNFWISEEKHTRSEYKNKVCIKPWGYEFLVYESNRIGMWYLNIIKDSQTSLHTHFHKDTLLFCISGTAKINLIDGEQLELGPLQSIYIPKYKFHGIGSFSQESYLLEIEIFDTNTKFTDKNDLLRIDDQYNRKNTGYESSVNTICESIDSFKHFFLKEGFTDTIENIDFNVWNLTETSMQLIKKNVHNIILKGSVTIEGSILKEGSFIKTTDIKSIEPDTLILSLNSIDYHENSKIVYTLEQLKIRCKKYKDKNIVLTSGCFDILHVGHLHNIKQASSLGDYLMICLSNDEQIKKLKGESRPVNNYKDRINLFKTIPYIDSIILYDEEDIKKEKTLGDIIKVVDPYTWVKGSDYTSKAIYEKHPYLKRIDILPNIVDKSTTNIIKKINQESK
jgi:rfaE bifunctional protein nucleotidyltransferase chain/domain